MASIQKYKTNRRRIIIIALLFFATLSTVALFIFFILFTPQDRQTIFSQTIKLSYKNTEREYIQYKPDKEAESIIIGLHGFGDTPRRFAYYTALQNVVNDTTLVVYPSATAPNKKGVSRRWNAGFCCGSGYFNKEDDSGFLKSLIDTLKQQNPKVNKAYVVGFSNGAFMAQRFAVDHPDSVNAVASISGAVGTEQSRLELKTPKSILITHGEKDKTVPFYGGPGASDKSFVWLSHQATLEAWQTNNKDRASTEHVTYKNNPHHWNGWRLFNIWHKKPQESLQVVQFFSKN